MGTAGGTAGGSVELSVTVLQGVNSFSTRRLSSCTEEYAHTYISTYSVQQ